ncbi:CsbD family protein [Streptomyces sp. Ru73]|uniref:CsbD family protein n=1 Tax=Streptomyces sp. Ru73 TaxID=2080748 RepID=UPI000CDD0817|nr:CsbD family protein [Streptomyces sp. Ru73]POX40193.1 CsbD family protein [Streptomyces sp. Ru73]
MADKGAMDKLKGKAKEMAGKATGDRRMKGEGKADQTKGKAKDAMDEVKGQGEGVKDSLTDRDRTDET